MRKVGRPQLVECLEVHALLVVVVHLRELEWIVVICSDPGLKARSFRASPLTHKSSKPEARGLYPLRPSPASASGSFILEQIAIRPWVALQTANSTGSASKGALFISVEACCKSGDVHLLGK